MTRGPAGHMTDAGLPSRLRRFAKTRWGGLAFAVVAVLIALAFEAAFEDSAHFHYIPMMAAVMAAALIAHRVATFTAIALSVLAHLLLVPQESGLNAMMNALLFAIVAYVMAEVCQRLIAALERSRALSHDLASRSALLDIILTSVPIATLDEDACILRLTATAADLLGVEMHVAVGRPFSDFARDFDTAALAALDVGETLRPPPVGHWTAHSPDGEETPLTIHASRLPDAVAPERFILSLGDQRQAQAARERANDFTAQLHKVWRLNSMGEMAATLAHELNQPLTAATVYLHAGQSDLARAGPLGDSAGRALELAKAQMLRAGDIIRRMRELIATGGDHTFTDERVSQMIEDLTPIFAVAARDAGATVRVDVQSTHDRVRADRIQIQQAISNLVRNAVEAASGRPNGLVVVTGRRRDTGYEILVEDNGPGIAEEQIDRIFQPMTTTKAGGMGLGLSVTRSIIESHESTLSVSRSPLGGAAFSFCLTPALEIEPA